MSNLYVWNIYEKSFTPYWAKLAPKHQVHRHVIQRHPNKQSEFFKDARTKSVVRFFREHVLKKTYWYITGVMLFAIVAEYSIKNSFIWAYKKKNFTHSLAFAQESERVYQEERRRTHPEEYEEDEEEVEEEAAAVEDDD